MRAHSIGLFALSLYIPCPHGPVRTKMMKCTARRGKKERKMEMFDPIEQGMRKISPWVIFELSRESGAVYEPAAELGCVWAGEESVRCELYLFLSFKRKREAGMLRVLQQAQHACCRWEETIL